ncbi:hypothetical protein VP01_27g4 [Puccinia sorghi]|uniref:Uncharacterized protein n=1 Tax=Puccinia sorghi TaxID=27349 RepID=A0A0L6V2I7_9BASI|nr:hypothetical protein VP01_27g4 [Puccinia sorghi]
MSLVVSETSSFQFFPEMENYSPIPLLKGKAKCGSVKLQFNLKVVLTFLHWKIDQFFHLPMHWYRLSFRLGVGLESHSIIIGCVTVIDSSKVSRGVTLRAWGPSFTILFSSIGPLVHKFELSQFFSQVFGFLWKFLALFEFGSEGGGGGILIFEDDMVVFQLPCKSRGETPTIWQKFNQMGVFQIFRKISIYHSEKNSVPTGLYMLRVPGFYIQHTITTFFILTTLFVFHASHSIPPTPFNQKQKKPCPTFPRAMKCEFPCLGSIPLRFPCFKIPTALNKRKRVCHKKELSNQRLTSPEERKIKSRFKVQVLFFKPIIANRFSSQLCYRCSQNCQFEFFSVNINHYRNKCLKLSGFLLQQRLIVYKKDSRMNLSMLQSNERTSIPKEIVTETLRHLKIGSTAGFLRAIYPAFRLKPLCDMPPVKPATPGHNLTPVQTSPERVLRLWHTLQEAQTLQGLPQSCEPCRTYTNQTNLMERTVPKKMIKQSMKQPTWKRSQSDRWILMSTNIRSRFQWGKLCLKEELLNDFISSVRERIKKKNRELSSSKGGLRSPSLDNPLNIVCFEQKKCVQLTLARILPFSLN